jgi:hypothetical protein
MNVKIPVTSVKMTPHVRESTTGSAQKEADIVEKYAPWASLFTVKRPFPIVRTLLYLDFAFLFEQEICQQEVATYKELWEWNGKDARVLPQYRRPGRNCSTIVPATFQPGSRTISGKRSPGKVLMAIPPEADDVN